MKKDKSSQEVWTAMAEEWMTPEEATKEEG